MSFAAPISAPERSAALIFNPARVGPPRPRPEGATLAWIVGEALQLHASAVERRIGAAGWVSEDGAPMRLRPASCVIEGDPRPLGPAAHVRFDQKETPAPESGWLGRVDITALEASVRVTLLGRFVRRADGAGCRPSRRLAGCATPASRAMAERAQTALTTARPDPTGFTDAATLEPELPGFAALVRAAARTEARVQAILPPGLQPRQREVHAFAEIQTGATLRITCGAFASQAAEGSDVLLRSVVHDAAGEHLIAVCLLRLGRGRVQ